MNILLLPEQRQIAVKPGTTLLQALQEAGVWLDAPCGGHGTCGKCKVRVTKGNDYEYTEVEIKYISQAERDEGVRLACCMKVKEDTCIILPISRQVKEPEIEKPPQIKYRKDGDRTSLGVAIDIGTTTVEYCLMNLISGAIVARKRFYNPQRKYGADVIGRISYIGDSDKKVKLLQQDLIHTINENIKEQMKNLGLCTQNIEKMVVVANTTMSHIFTGHNPKRLAKAPFQPEYFGGSIHSAKELGFSVAEGTTLEMLPIIGGHIGADTMGCLETLQLDRLSGNHLLVDIGTNGEMVCKGEEGLVACSTAAGPAFEGASITYGMSAEPGAITKVIYDNHKIKLQVEGGVKPKGISGSGIIDLVAVLLKAGILDSTGYLKEEYCSVDPLTGQEGYCLSKDRSGIFLTRQDIRQLQLAKAAIAAGIKVLLEHMRITPKELTGIWLAGAFGTHLNLENAMAIGLLPRVEALKYHQVGNAALQGAILRLQGEITLEELKDLASHVSRVELADMEHFRQLFIENIALVEG